MAPFARQRFGARLVRGLCLGAMAVIVIFALRSPTPDDAADPLFVPPVTSLRGTDRGMRLGRFAASDEGVEKEGMEPRVPLQKNSFDISLLFAVPATVWFVVAIYLALNADKDNYQPPVFAKG
eukprot:CAMPEP_0117547710 /NCGR_PEP_ID=MMETSP0784-20121206/47268_1 /TAXON_ID=39447 /ORGANISM="" /LENGTH=122 /DNA_ID=CAMNT_0005344631 /DNA_START=15 /DNA_END=383 /DNA_ORIENTATION=+